MSDLSSSAAPEMPVTTTIRPRRGDLEAATQPHPFRPSGERAVAPVRIEVCDLCGMAQRGTWVHPDA